MDAATIASLENIIKVIQILGSCALAVTVWDWLVSLRSEYTRIWKSEWSPAKCLYLFNRYWSLISGAFVIFCYNASITAEECSHIFRMIVALPMWNSLASEAILALRTYAFLGRDKRLLALLIALLLGEMVFLLYVVFKGVVQVPGFAATGPCTASGEPTRTNIVTGFFVAPVIFDFFVTTLTVVKAVQIQRNFGTRSGLVKIFVQEGLVYFLIITTCNLINLAFFVQADQTIQGVFAMPTILISSVLTCRLVLSLRDPNIAKPMPASVSNSYPQNSGTGSKLHRESRSKQIHPTSHEIPLSNIGGARDDDLEKAAKGNGGIHVDVEVHKRVDGYGDAASESTYAP